MRSWPRQVFLCSGRKIHASESVRSIIAMRMTTISPGRQPVLKVKAQRWLIQKSEVLAFVQAKPAEGGAGAMLVLLAPGAR